MSITQQVEQMIAGIQPMLKMQGRDVSITEATESRIALTLSGFCDGCSCSTDYVEGLKEMLTEQFPEVKEINLEVA